MTPLILLPLLFLPGPVPGPACPEPDALAMFRQWSRSASPELRIQAVRVLGGKTSPESRVALFSLLGDPHPAVRAAVRATLIARPSGERLAPYVAALRDARAREQGARVILARREDPTLLLQDKQAAVRARILARGDVSPRHVRPLLQDRSPKVRALAIETLDDPAAARPRDAAEEVRIASARVLRDPSPLLRDRSWRVRLAAIRAAERRRVAAALPHLIARLGEEPPGRVRMRLARTLEVLTQVPFGDDAGRWRTWWARKGPGFVLPPPRRKKRAEHTTARIAFRRIPVHSRRICFVIDASRSMEKPAPGAKGKSRWQLVVRDLLGVLERLPRDARFNVVLFRTDVEAWAKRLQPAARGARARCRRWIEKAKPAGWTNLFDALEVALADDDVDALYVLTDGVPSRGAETKRRAILDEIAYLNRYRLVQINCVQAGGSEGLSKAWRGFLDDLAKAHDGQSVRE